MGDAATGAARSVAFAHVCKRFGDVSAVEDVSFAVAPGQFVTLLGPSGCGKSTTLNMIAGLELPTAGRVVIGGRDVTYLPPAERDVAMVFQSYALYPHLSVFENIAFPLRARRRRQPDEVVRRKVREAAEMLGLAGLLDRLPRQISGGQRQRVALGRAMVRTPTVYLLDEPLSNLDQQLRVQMRSELKDLHLRLGATMIYVTHDQGEAMTLSDTIAVMSGGRIEQLGSPRALYERPANLFVARFLGEPGMNVFEGRLDAGGFAAAGVALARPPSLAAPVGPIYAGIRPEDLAPVSMAATAIRGRARTVEFLGARALLRLDVAGQIVTAFVPLDAALEPGDKFCSVFNFFALLPGEARG
jgi:ABC-type sugar transport system ATPase subunit